MSNQKTCGVCEKVFFVPDSRKETAKYCSRHCSDKKPQTNNQVMCTECGKPFHLKKSAHERNKVWGSFCSSACSSAFRSRISIGSNNPNYRGRQYDNDGYRLYNPSGKKSMKEHRYVAMQKLGLKKIPKGAHIHHRDCNHLNNDESNLQILSVSDHKWIHKEYGSCVLWAIEQGKLDIDQAVEWSSDRIRARHILTNNINTQSKLLSILGIVDPDEALIQLSRKPILVTFEVVEDLSDTERGTGGFGSTGA